MHEHWSAHICVAAVRQLDRVRRHGPVRLLGAACKDLLHVHVVACRRDCVRERDKRVKGVVLMVVCDKLQKIHDLTSCRIASRAGGHAKEEHVDECCVDEQAQRGYKNEAQDKQMTVVLMRNLSGRVQ